MPYAVEVNDWDGFESLKQSVQAEAEDEARKGAIGEANRNVHRVEAIRNPHGEPDFGESRAVIAQYDQGFRPGSNRGQLGSMKFYPEECLPGYEGDPALGEEHPDIDEVLLGERLEYSSSPYVDKREMRPSERRPEENVQAAHDIWSIDPAIEEQLGVDVDLLATDISRTRNVPKLDLDEKAQDGIETIKARKGELITDRKELRQKAGRILQEFPGYHATGKPALQTKGPIELAEFVDRELEHYLNNHQVNQTRADDLWNRTQNLWLAAEDVAYLGEETEEVSQDEFRHTLKQPGFDRPASVGAEDAVDDYGVGDKQYLGLL